MPDITPDEAEEVTQAIAVYRAAPTTTSTRAIDRLMTELASGYPNQKLGAEEAEARLEVYARQLCDFPADVLAAGMRAAQRACTFFPTIAEIREHVGKQPWTPRQLRQARLEMLLAEHRRRVARRRPDEAEPLSREDIRAMSADLRKMGLARGWITQAEIDAADAAREEARVDG